jgi:hypothetical protein
MGIKLLSPYPLKQFQSVFVPMVQITCKGEFRQEKRQDKYVLYTVFYMYVSDQRDNYFEINSLYLELDECPSDPLIALYTAFKERYLANLEYEDI